MESWSAVAVPKLPRRGTPLRLFDTSSGGVVDVHPPETARMYVCGITPYDATHMGHANTYLAFDLVNRIWRDHGHAVKYVQNVTDIDDPLLERAVATGQDWREIAARETALFRDDMAALRVLPPDHYIGAVESMSDVVTHIEQLLASGAAYKVDGDIYFSVRSDSQFGTLSRLSVAEMVEVFAGRGGDPKRAGKKDPLDCLLWQQARADEPSWPSPLGNGRPGWHIECTAIALRYLGTEFDVQGGGSDLVFPHHEMCASQARSLTDKRFTKHYVHAGMVGLDGEKMSKSRGNLVFVSSLRRDGCDPMVIRLALLSHHYRQDWMWSAAALDTAAARLSQWRSGARASHGPDAIQMLDRVRTCLVDDLDTPGALSAIDAWAGEAASGNGSDPGAPALVRQVVDALLGVQL